jgi:large subunit ribosomal protein L5
MTALTLSSNEFFQQGYKKMADAHGTKNMFAVPKIAKVVINVGIGKLDKAQKDEVIDQIEKLTGQIPRKITSRISIAGFKMRAGELVGVSVTLRGQKMRDFVFNTVYLALPRTKDFKGISAKAFDSNFAAYSLGIPDSSIYPQIGFSAKFNFGMQVTISFKSQTEANKELLQSLSFPFKK